jgi:hypothetical protein
MNTSPLPPEWTEVQRFGPALTRHRGTLLAGGVMWLAPLVFLPAAVLSLGRAELAFVGVMAGLGLLTAAPLVAAWRQTVELFPRHLVWTKWGRARAIAYSNIRDIRSGMRAQAAQGARAGLIEQRFLDLHLRDGEKITLIEMSRHDDLSRRLAECLEVFADGGSPGAEALSTGGRRRD